KRCDARFADQPVAAGSARGPGWISDDSTRGDDAYWRTTSAACRSYGKCRWSGVQLSRDFRPGRCKHAARTRPGFVLFAIPPADELWPPHLRGPRDFEL